jgi:hypothetical protein
MWMSLLIVFRRDISFLGRKLEKTKLVRLNQLKTLKSGAVSGAETVFRRYLTGYSALIKRSIPEINPLNPEIRPLYPRVLTLNQNSCLSTNLQSSTNSAPSYTLVTHHCDLFWPPRIRIPFKDYFFAFLILIIE